MTSTRFFLIFILLGMVESMFNPSSWEAEMGRSLSLKPARSTKQVQAIQGYLYSKTLSPKANKQKLILLFIIYVQVCICMSDVYM